MSTDLLRLHNPLVYKDEVLPPEVIWRLFEEADASWIHDGDQKKPHAELASGLCSNGFFDCSRVLKYPGVAETLVNQLVLKLKAARLLDHRSDWVVGSSYAAITFSYEVARALHACHGFVEKDPGDKDGKRMLWRREKIPAGTVVLQAEELITTSDTFREVRRAIEEGNGETVNFLPIVVALVHRPPKLPADYGDRQVFALVGKEVWAVKPEDCPLCKAGSPRYRPKTHWKELTGKS